MALQLDAQPIAAEDRRRDDRANRRRRNRRLSSAARPASATRPPVAPSRSSSVSAAFASSARAVSCASRGGTDFGTLRPIHRGRAEAPTVRSGGTRRSGPSHRPLRRQFGADDWCNAGGGRRFVEARRAVDAVAIEERERGIAERGGTVDERFRQRRALQKAERRRSVELDVRGGHDTRMRRGSVDNPVNKPSARVAIAEDSVHGPVAERDVPLVAVPTMVGR